MKKLIAMMMVVLTLATAGMASAQVITEQKLSEVILTEDIISEETNLTETNKTAHKEPNYIVTIGGDRLVDVEVNHHPKFVLKVMNGTKKAFAKIKSVFHHKDKKAATLDN